MNLNSKKYQYYNSNDKLSQSQNGPEDLSTLIEEQKRQLEKLHRQNNELSIENFQLTQKLDNCNYKIRKLIESTQSLLREQENENLKLAELISTTEKTAEEIIADAKHKAAQIITGASVEAEHIHEKMREDITLTSSELEYIADILNAARDSSNLHFNKLNTVLKNAAEFVSILQKEIPHRAPEIERPDENSFGAAIPENKKTQIPRRILKEPAAEMSKDLSVESARSIYENFLKELNEEYNKVPRGKVIERFGDENKIL